MSPFEYITVLMGAILFIVGTTVFSAIFVALQIRNQRVVVERDRVRRH